MNASTDQTMAAAVDARLADERAARAGGALGTQVGGRHYQGMDPSPLEVILAWDLDFVRGNVLKYLARAGRKGGPEQAVEDIDKAVHYLQVLRAEYVDGRRS